MQRNRFSLLTIAMLGLARLTSIAQPSMSAPHPSWDLYDMRPATFELRNGGLDFLSDGRLVVTDWGEDMKVLGKVFIVSGMSGTDKTKVTWAEFASGLKEPLGIKVVNDTIYVICKDGLWMLPDGNKDGKADENRKVVGGWSYPPKTDGGERWHLFNFGLLYKDGFFYGTLGSEYPPSATQGKDRGSLVKMDPKKGTFEIMTGGLRTPNGIGFGPDGEIFGAENQGHWMPGNKLNNFRKGRNYGMHNDPAHPYDIASVPQSPPAVWMDEGEIALSPSQPIYVTKGTYAGQMLIGDVSFGGLQRIFLEKIGTEYQGVAFKFAGGFEAGTNRLAWGPDGALYVGQIGNGGTNWGWKDKRYGLTKLVDNKKPTFEILAIRSRKNGMEVEFTEPVSAGTADPAKFAVQTWTNTPQEGYGAGNHIDKHALVIKAATLSPDKKSVFLEMDGLKTNYVLNIKTLSVTSADNKAPWASEGWYTLNAISTSSAFEVPVSIDPKLYSPQALASEFKIRLDEFGIVAQVPFKEAFSISLLDLQGRKLAAAQGHQAGSFHFSISGLSHGTYLVEVKVKGRSFSRSINLM
jgi:cytochrome c